MKASPFTGTLLLAILLAAPSRADDTPGAEQIDLTRDTQRIAVDATGPSPEVPPADALRLAAPYEKSLVLDSSIGALAFLGQFGKVAPPGPWMRVQLGYELLRWLMLYGEGELAFTDTSNREAAPRTRAFPIFGFGGGARFTIRFGERVGVYLQPGLGLLKADIANNALGILGFRDAESLDVWLGGRLGVELYQIDRHLALGLTSQLRVAQGFAKTGASRDTPLALDGGLALRYAF